MIQIAGKVISTILGVLTIAVMTRYLGKTGFGQFTTITAYLQFFGILVDFGLALVVIQMISQPNADTGRIMSNIFTLRFFSAVIFLGLAPLIVIFFPYSPIVKLGIAITTLSFLFVSLNQIMIGIFQKNLRMDKVSIAEVSGRLALLALVLVFARLDWGLISIMSAVIIGSFCNFLINFLFSLRYVRIRFAFDRKIWKEIISTAWPLAISISFNLIYMKADTIILSVIKPQADVGIYGATYRVLEILVTFPMMFCGIILPILTAAYASGEMGKFRRVLQRSFDLMSMLAIPLSVGTIMLAKRIMVLVAGKEFEASGDALKIIIVATSIIFIGSLFGHAIVAIKKQKQMVWGYVATAAISLAGYFIFIPKYSYFGAAYVTVFSELMIALLTFAVVYRTTKILPSLAVFMKSLIAAAAMALFIHYIAALNLFLIVSLSMFVYFSVLYLAKGFDKETLLEIFSFRKKTISQ